MAWLHENKEEFRNAVLFAADQNREQKGSGTINFL